MRKILASATVVLLTAVAGCTESGPSSRDEVCLAFTELGQQIMQSNGLFDNPVFWKAEKLGDLAERYEGSPNLTSDADALHRIADADSTSGMELMSSTRGIADLCGHPLGIGN